MKGLNFVKGLKWTGIAGVIGMLVMGCTATLGVNALSQANSVDLTTAQNAVTSAAWGNNVNVTVNGSQVTIQSDGLPSHERLDFYAIGNRSIADAAIAQNTSFTIPLQPELAAAPTDTGGGAIGIAVSGAVFFNPFEGSQTTYALEANYAVNGAPFIDACNGHTVPNSGTYHYHGIPYCITDALDTAGEHSVIVGYLLDGFAIYGPQDVDGDIPTDLDGCNGHFGATLEFPEGVYHYHTTEVRPYVPTCYSGEVTITRGPPRR
jgi:hypothetical protein